MASAGRPRTFDKEQALNKAMYVFWEKGYEGTTMVDLVESIGMQAPSIYAAFGNKDAIFKEVVQRYLPIVFNGQLSALNSSPNIDEAVERSLKECVSLFTGTDNPHTCLIMTAAINAAPEHAEHIEALKSLRKEYSMAWIKRFEKAKADEQLLAEADSSALAEYFTTLIQGMALKAKDGASKNTLSSITEMSLKTLSQFTSNKQT
jgi:AcrR family transcriptional regulator